jgi:hypothetical protein
VPAAAADDDDDEEADDVLAGPAGDGADETSVFWFCKYAVITYASWSVAAWASSREDGITLKDQDIYRDNN